MFSRQCLNGPAITASLQYFRCCMVVGSQLQCCFVSVHDTLGAVTGFYMYGAAPPCHALCFDTSDHHDGAPHLHTPKEHAECAHTHTMTTAKSLAHKRYGHVLQRFVHCTQCTGTMSASFGIDT